jgi:hypothetical protein
MTDRQQELWPNANAVVEGIIPTSEVSQDPYLFEEDDDEDLEEQD